MRLFTRRLASAVASSAPKPIRIPSASSSAISPLAVNEFQEAAADDMQIKKTVVQPVQVVPDEKILASLARLEQRRTQGNLLDDDLNAFKRDLVHPRNAEIIDRTLRLGLSILEQEEASQAQRYIALGLLRNTLERAEGNLVHPHLVTELYKSFRSANLGSLADASLADLKLFEILLNKYPTHFNEEQLGPIVERLAGLCYYGFEWSGPAKAAPADRVNADAVQQLPESTSPSITGGLAGRLRNQRSTSSIGSTASRSRPGPRSHRNAELPAQVRLKALNCLSELAKTHWKELHAYWHLFLDSKTPSLPELLAKEASDEVRIAATQAMTLLLRRSSGYLALAQESTSETTSFTSLSARLAEMIIGLHRRCSSMLCFPLSDPLRDAMLQLAEALVINTNYERIRTPVLHQLLATFAAMPPEREGSLSARLPIWASTASATIKNPEVCKKSAHTFIYAFKRISAILMNPPEELDADQLVLYWQTLIALAPRYDSVIKNEVALAAMRKTIDRVRSTFAREDEAIRVVQLKFLISLAPCASDLHSTALEDTVRTVLEVISASPDTSKSEAKSAADLVGSMHHILIQDSQHLLEYAGMLEALAPHEDNIVRCSTYRAMAPLLSSPLAEHEIIAINKLYDLLLAAAQDLTRPQAAAEAAHVLANGVETGSSLSLVQEINQKLFAVALSMATDSRPAKTAENMRVESMRLLGHLLTSSSGDLSEAQHEQGRKALVDALNGSWPKVQWNAAIAMQGVLAEQAEPDAALVEALWRSLSEGKNVKVRRNALSALEAARGVLEQDEAADRLRQVVVDLQALRDSLPFEEAARAEALQKTVEQILDKIPGSPAPTKSAPSEQPTFAKEDSLGEVQSP